MLAALIFTIALVAMVQFGLFYWRAVMTSVATLPISSRVLEAAFITTSWNRRAACSVSSRPQSQIGAPARPPFARATPQYRSNVACNPTSRKPPTCAPASLQLPKLSCCNQPFFFLACLGTAFCLPAAGGRRSATLRSIRPPQ